MLQAGQSRAVSCVHLSLFLTKKLVIVGHWEGLMSNLSQFRAGREVEGRHRRCHIGQSVEAETHADRRGDALFQGLFDSDLNQSGIMNLVQLQNLYERTDGFIFLFGLLPQGVQQGFIDGRPLCSPLAQGASVFESAGPLFDQR